MRKQHSSALAAMAAALCLLCSCSHRFTLTSGNRTVAILAGADALTVESLRMDDGEYLCPSEFSMPENLTLSFSKCDRISRSGEKGFCFHYLSEEGPEVLVYLVTSSCGGGVFEFHTDIVNPGDAPYRIVPGTFASFALRRSEQPLELFAAAKESGIAEGFTNFNGQVFEGTGIYNHPLGIRDSLNLRLRTTVLQNWNENGYLPLVFVHTGQGGVFTGYEWSSGNIAVRCTPGDTPVHISVDMDDIAPEAGAFSTLVPAGDTLSLPRIYLSAYRGSLDDGSNAFKRWFFACKVPSQMRADKCEPYTQTDMQRGLDARGVEAVKWDYGWWSDERLDNWETLEGSWKLRDGSYRGVLDSYGCSTIADFTAAARRKGVSLTTYALLHDTRDASGNVTASEGEFNSISHPDWFSCRNLDRGMGNTADLGNSGCVRFVIDSLGDFLQRNGITTWRSDFEPICYTSDKTNRHDSCGTDVQYWATVGFREVIKGLREAYPALRYESCSSGGSMKDMFTATQANVINCDDASNYLGLRTTFYDSSYILHPSQLLLPSNADFHNTDLPDKMWPKIDAEGMDEGEFHRAMMDMGYRSICIGVPMFSSWTGTIELDYYEKYSGLYKSRIRPLVRKADLYHILPRPDGIRYDGIEYFDPQEGTGAIFLFKPSKLSGTGALLHLRGLDADKSYRLEFEDREEQNTVASGKTLMEEGLKAVIEEAVGSEIIWISENQK